MFSVLLFTRLRSDIVFLSAVGILYVTGVLSAEEALSGMSQTSVVVVGVLFVVIAGLTYTGVLQWIVKTTDDTRRGSQLILEQHHRRGAFCEYRQAVVEKTRHIALQTPYSAQLRVRHGRRVYAYRYAA